MVKRKVPEGWVGGAEVRNADLEPLLANVSAERENTGVVASLPETETVTEVVTAPVELGPSELIGQEVSTSELFWQLLAGFECW